MEQVTNDKINGAETQTVPSSFKAVDILLLALTVLPVAIALVLKVLTTPASEGISITGALIYFTIPMPLQNMPITTLIAVIIAAVVSTVILLILFFDIKNLLKYC